MFKLQSKDRLDLWKQFRASLDSMTLQDSLTTLVDFWQGCPFIPYYLEPESCNHWPDPWKLILENYYCDLAKALGMLYTMHLTKHGQELDPQLRIYHDSKQRINYHIAYFCQGKYVLNLAEGAVVNKQQINQQLKLKYCYTAADLKLEQY
jgi:hypothetical protein